MADLIPQPIWNWVSKGWRSMEDLADKIDDLICTFEGGGDTTMDTLAMYAFGWMLIGLFVLGTGKFLYGRFLKGRLPGLLGASGEGKGDEAPSTPAPGKGAPVLPATPAVTSAPLTATAPAKTPLSAPGGGGGGKFVPPTPPSRRRLGSKSGGRPVLGARPKSQGAHPPPTTTGPEAESVKWVNELFSWLYSDLVVVNELLNIWIQSLNEFTKKSVAEHGVGVEFVRVLPETPAPNISNVFCECAPNDDVTITCDCEATPAMQLKVFRQRGEKVEVSHYRLNVNRFRARLNIFAVSEKLLTDVKCDGWPDIKVSLAQVGAIKNNLDETQLQDVICDIVTTALRATNVHYNFTQYPNCPRLIRNLPDPSQLLPVHYDSMFSSSTEKVCQKRLLVKVLKANGLGCSQGCTEPFCVVEVDEPSQKNQTSAKKGTDNPNWDEHFLFDVNNNTSEVLLEVYDKCQGESKFLGHGIVSMDELITNPSQRQVIALQSAPYNEAPVTGTVTVEFHLIEGADIPMTGDKPFKLKETLRSVSPSGAVLTTTKTVFAQPNTDRLTNGGEGVADSALKELERSRGLQPSKSTLIIHSVQRMPQPQILKVEMTETGTWHEVSEPKQGMNAPPQDIADPQDPNGTMDRGRSRRKKRDFFGTLRRRLNKSKTRSRSMGPASEDENGMNSMARSISADRARDASVHSNVPGVHEGSARSSLSEVSGISGASSRTYINEASTLVLETVENGINKYYLVPLSLAQRSKWKKKGTKLHIFNDHTFIARHLPGGTVCQVCKKTLPRRLGKQGYECRDCVFKCHKHCHVKVETTCPTSNIHSIELVPVTDSPFTSRKFKKAS